ncbi:FitA-like ribbon-helix-helix domain-containing protein [Streptosporangium sandarakinum]|uniref:FitA-like ribbon-helix-helix domain-containing protein n=1 Tax=Streptosporangium sandarakinum TaxID=1260955 RepID=UPI0036ABF0E4
MATIQIRNVPDEVYLTYKERAMRARQSLQEYLLSKLVSDAGRPSLEEILDRAAANAVDTFSAEDVIEELDRGRSGR